MLKNLTVSGLRNLELSLNFSPNVNVIVGVNGSGKSSILEAIHFLSFGRSFRAASADLMINTQSEYASIQATVEQRSLPYSISAIRYRGKSQVKLQESSVRLSKVIPLLPTLFVDCDSHRSFFSSITYRQRFLDWLVFHVEPGYMQWVRIYNKALLERNSALKLGMSPTPWDPILHEQAMKIHTARQNIFKQLQVVLSKKALFSDKLSLFYFPGFDSDTGLLSDLKGSLQRDIQLRRTTKGPHKADWVVRTKQDDAKNILSQGQQKTAHLKIVMAHKEIMSMDGKKPLLLIDDLSAELDSQHRILINQLIEAGNGQSIITAVLEKDAGIYPSERLFHVKQGAEVRD